MLMQVLSSENFNAHAFEYAATKLTLAFLGIQALQMLGVIAISFAPSTRAIGRVEVRENLLQD